MFRRQNAKQFVGLPQAVLDCRVEGKCTVLWSHLQEFILFQQCVDLSIQLQNNLHKSLYVELQQVMAAKSVFHVLTARLFALNQLLRLLNVLFGLRGLQFALLASKVLQVVVPGWLDFDCGVVCHFLASAASVLVVLDLVVCLNLH